MFEQALAVEFGRSNRAWTTMVGMAGQALAVATAVLFPMVAPDTMPPPQALVRLFLPTAPPPPPPAPSPGATRAPEVKRQQLQVRPDGFFAPRNMPSRAVIIDEPPLTAAELGGGNGVQGGVQGGIEGGIFGGLPGAVARTVPPPAPAAAPAPATAPAKPAEPQRITVGGNVQQALLIRQVVPLYPQLAQKARIWGDVELVGVVGTDGRIRHLQATSGHPMLVPAALDAVRQWIYRPTYLNGDPVEVVAPITVRFRLN